MGGRGDDDAAAGAAAAGDGDGSRNVVFSGQANKEEVSRSLSPFTRESETDSDRMTNR
jgi:hypothetical protein